VHRRINSLLPGLTSLTREPLVLNKYERGDYYYEHDDFRRATVLIYLNDDFTGGATFFPQINLRVYPKLGRAVVFFPNRAGMPFADSSSSVKPYMSHIAEEVLSGQKITAQVWLRENISLSIDAHLAAYNEDVAKFRSTAEQGTLRRMNETHATDTQGNELCCMCSKFKMETMQMVAFSAEDYDLDADGQVECLQECFGKCSEKGGTYMGCYDEETMVQMQESWAMTGMLKVKEDDGPGDIC